MKGYPQHTYIHTDMCMCNKRNVCKNCFFNILKLGNPGVAIIQSNINPKSKGIS